MLVFQHEVIRYVESVGRLVDCSDEAMALDAIAEVAPATSLRDTASQLCSASRRFSTAGEGWLSASRLDMRR